MHEDPVVPRIAEALRLYGREAPNAADSERGIREWWLAGMEPPPTPEQVAEALYLLEREGSFVKITLDDGSLLWRAAAGLP